MERSHHYDRRPSLLRLFIHPAENGVWGIPVDLRERLLAFVPEPPQPQLAGLEQIPEQPPREWTSNNEIVLHAATRRDPHVKSPSLEPSAGTP
jgi:hypothetical protein